jgi:hypothetical protein
MINDFLPAFNQINSLKAGNTPHMCSKKTLHNLPVGQSKQNRKDAADEKPGEKKGIEK